MEGRKIPRNIDNPLDNVLIDLVDVLNPYFKQLNFTPNMITTISLVFGIITNMAYFKNYYLVSAAALLVSYFFDCMDGNYARKYDMQSKFGDLYDHYKDWAVIIVLLLLFIRKKVSNTFKIASFISIIIVLLGTYVHVGCTEKYIKDSNGNAVNSGSLGQLTSCPDIKYLKLTKYFGTGTFNLLLILIIVSHKYI